jgi:hypothetical protein
VVPFQRIPFNTVSEGAGAMRDLTKWQGPTRKNVATMGAIGAGGLAATQTQDPITLALVSALMGRRALPFALGATGSTTAIHGPSKARHLAERIGTGIPDIGMGDAWHPTRPIFNPAIINWLKYLKGEK